MYSFGTWLHLFLAHIWQHKKIAILKCTSAYPAPQEHLNLNSIPTLRKKYKCAIGYSDHTVNEVAPIVATVLGATIIEKLPPFILLKTTSIIFKENFSIKFLITSRE